MPTSLDSLVTPRPPAPMLAGNTPWDLSSLDVSPFNPIIASRKIDGERILCADSRIYTRSGKPVPNRHINTLLSHPSLHGLDGEITVGSPTDPLCRTKTRSGVSRQGGAPDFTYWVFDDWTRNLPFDLAKRLAMQEHIKDLKLPFIRWVEQILVEDRLDLLNLYEDSLAAGYEGLLLRRPTQLYRRTGAKENRCTWAEWRKGQGMLKLKLHDDLEAEVIGWEPWRENTNPMERSPLGKAERSSAKAGLVADPSRLGALIVRPLPAANHSFAAPFNVGSAVAGVWDEAERRRLASLASALLGRRCIVRFHRSSLQSAPAQPRFVAWSNPTIDED